jgi:hypothetical protein
MNQQLCLFKSRISTWPMDIARWAGHPTGALDLRFPLRICSSCGEFHGFLSRLLRCLIFKSSLHSAADTVYRDLVPLCPSLRFGATSAARNSGQYGSISSERVQRTPPESACPRRCGRSLHRSRSATVQDFLCVAERFEDVGVRALCAQPHVERLDVRDTHQLPGQLKSILPFAR